MATLTLSYTARHFSCWWQLCLARNNPSQHWTSLTSRVPCCFSLLASLTLTHLSCCRPLLLPVLTFPCRQPLLVEGTRGRQRGLRVENWFLSSEVASCSAVQKLRCCECGGGLLGRAFNLGMCDLDKMLSIFFLFQCGQCPLDLIHVVQQWCSDMYSCWW